MISSLSEVNVYYYAIMSVTAVMRALTLICSFFNKRSLFNKKEHRVRQNVVHFSTHHNFGTGQDKAMRFSPKQSDTGL